MPAVTIPSNSSKDHKTKELLSFWYSHSYPDLSKKLSPVHTTSKGTRAPREFDLHLHPSLQLKHVKHSPNILSDLSDIALRSSESKKDFPSLHRSKFSLRNQQKFNDTVNDIEPIANEVHVGNAYKLLVGDPTAQIAAILELEADRWENNILTWALQSTPGTGRSAVADGFLRINRSVLASKSCPDKVRTLTSLFGDLAVWEFKNILAGRYTVMKSIMLLSEEPAFHWQTCTKPCLDDMGLPLLNGARMGFDSEKPHCSVNHATWTLDPDEEENLKARERNMHRTGARLPRLSTHPNPTDRKEARHIVQQAWAEATKHDCTFIIIHSGIYEIIGIRCRATQTLYLSDLIEPSRSPEPSSTSLLPFYSQLQIGLFIAIVRDAINRANHLSGKEDSCHSWGRAFSNTFMYEKEDNRALYAQSRKVEIDKYPTQDPKELLRILRSANGLSLQSKTQNQISAHFSGTYYRYGIPVSSCSSEPPLIIKIPTPGSIMPLSSVVEGSVRVRPDGTPNFVEFQGASGFPRKVAVKLAPWKKSRKQLQHEYDCYKLIHQQFEGKMGPRIPELIGFFIRDDGEHAVLIMEQVGTQDSECNLKGGTPNSKKRTYMSSPLESMESYKRYVDILHASGMIHGSLSLEHFLCDPNRQGDDGPLTALVSLENAKLAGGAEIIAERQDLISLLAPFEPRSNKRPKRSDQGTGLRTSCGVFSIAFVGPLTRTGNLDGSGVIDDILRSDPDFESESLHGSMERIHHSDDSIEEMMIPFLTKEGCSSFRDKWMQKMTDPIDCQYNIELDFPVFLGPVSATADVESLLREVKLRHSVIIPRHKSAVHIKAHSKGQREWLAIPFLNVKDCKKFGSIWDGVGREDVTCYCYTRGHKIGLPYEFD